MLVRNNEGRVKYRTSNMSGWDEGGVFYHNPNGGDIDGTSENANQAVATDKFLKFIRNFLHQNAFIYRY